ncbi:MAG: tetratricopeptide repeat protein [Gemmataceae bacterium]
MGNWICRWKIYGPVVLLLSAVVLLFVGVVMMLIGDWVAAACLNVAAKLGLLVNAWTGKWWNQHLKALKEINKQQFAEAAETYQNALRQGGFPPSDPRRAVLLDGLAQAVKGIGDFADAEPIAREAVETAKAAWGERSVAVAIMQVNLGNIYLDLARMDEAQRCYQASMDLIRALKGDRHPLVSFCVNNLGVVATMRRDHASAEGRYREALSQMGRKAFRKTPNPGLARNNLASALVEQGKLEEAERLAMEATDLFRRVLPAQHFWQALPRHNLAQVRLKQGRLDEAEELSQEAVAMTERSLGPEHPLLAKFLHVLVKVLMARDDWDEAERLCMRELRLREDYLVPSHPDLADTVRAYAELLRRTGRLDQAADLLGQSRERKAAFLREMDTAIRSGGRWQVREA